MHTYIYITSLSTLAARRMLASATSFVPLVPRADSNNVHEHLFTNTFTNKFVNMFTNMSTNMLIAIKIS